MATRGRISSQRVLRRLSSDNSSDSDLYDDSERQEYNDDDQGPHYYDDDEAPRDYADDEGPHDYDDEGPHDYNDHGQTESLATAQISEAVDQQSNNNNVTVSPSHVASLGLSQTQEHNSTKELTLTEVHNSLSGLIKQEIGGLDKRVTAVERLVAKNITKKKQDDAPKPPVRVSPCTLIRVKLLRITCRRRLG